MAHQSLIKGPCGGPGNLVASHGAICVNGKVVFFPSAEHAPNPSRRPLELRRGSRSNSEAETWSLQDGVMCVTEGRGKGPDRSRAHITFKETSASPDLLL